MAYDKIQITCRDVLILTVLLFATVAAGVPLAEVHSHANAIYGHAHDLHDHDAGGANSAVYVPSGDDADQLHFHDIGAQSLTMLDTSDIGPMPCVQSAAGTPPPTTRPPDNPIAQRFRPPIA